jgi:hypothetical protein
LADYPQEDILWVLPDVPALYTDIVELVRSSNGALNFNDALIALSCHHRDISFIASFDRDFDEVSSLVKSYRPIVSKSRAALPAQRRQIVISGCPSISICR